jgi:hypothetical protein
MIGADPFLYDSAKVASAASHGIDSVRDRALPLPAGSKQANDVTGIGIRADRRASELVRDWGLKAPPSRRSTYVTALAITGGTRFSTSGRMTP